MRAPRYSIILAAGQGTRMQSANLHKVCFPIDGKPAINRSLETYNTCGIAHHVIVVGAMAQQVMETVTGECGNVIFAYQARQMGTAHAARIGAEALKAVGAQAEVLIVAGDRLIEPQVLEQFFDLFYGRDCDLAFLALPRRRPAGLGRVLLNQDGSVLGNLEAADIRQRRICAELRAAALEGQVPSREEMLALIREQFSDRKAARAFGGLWERLRREGPALSGEEILALVPEELARFQFRDREGKAFTLSPLEAEEAPLYNSSVYLLKTSCLEYALSRLDRNNAQGEEYLSDVITILAPGFRVQALVVEDEKAVMAFNDPAELLEIEAHVQARKSRRLQPETLQGPFFRKIGDWLEAFRSLSREQRPRRALQRALRAELEKLYGREEGLLAERLEAYLRLLERSAEVLGEEEKILLVRSPGRVNLMGRHVDHQGGNCNLMTIGYETLVAVRPRQDDRVRLHNLDRQRFPDREFAIGELLAELPWDDWVSLINSEKVSHLVLSAGGDWSQYVKAAVLRLQKKFSSRQLCGLDLMVSGNIPMAAGLSSSSALVVATAEALVAVNRLNTFPSQFVDLCGEGEWFVGTRGGSADHAAIKYGQRGKVVKVTFFDFAVEEIVAFPPEHTLLVCDSGVKAQKTTNAKDQFNHRVACYRIGALLIRKLFPQYAPLIRHLRDVNTRTLGVPLAWIYKILLHLPEKATRRELEGLIPGPELETYFGTHREPDDGLYPIRGVVLYGLSECERSRRFAADLEAGRLEEIGRLMNVSHDGDRVVRFDEQGEASPYSPPTDNGYLLGLIEDLDSGDPQRVLPAQLEWQPGSYHCSIAEIDHMVDLSLTVQGVLGAQLAGAGLGGCMMVLVHNRAVRNLAETLQEHHFRPYGRTASLLRCSPTSGSTVLLSR